MTQNPPNNNSSHPGSSPPLYILNFGNVEFSAFTTFIGSSVKSLILGGAGVAWATMSALSLMGASDDVART